MIIQNNVEIQLLISREEQTPSTTAAIDTSERRLELKVDRMIETVRGSCGK